MILKQGDIIFIARRRLFVEDRPHFFVGQVDQFSDGIIQTTGFAWIKEHLTGSIIMLSDKRTKIVAVASSSLQIYLLPRELVIEELKIKPGHHQTTILTDNKGYTMDISDRVPPGM